MNEKSKNILIKDINTIVQTISEDLGEMNVTNRKTEDGVVIWEKDGEEYLLDLTIGWVPLKDITDAKEEEFMEQVEEAMGITQDDEVSDEEHRNFISITLKAMGCEMFEDKFMVVAREANKLWKIFHDEPCEVDGEMLSKGRSLTDEQAITQVAMLSYTQAIQDAMDFAKENNKQ